MIIPVKCFTCGKVIGDKYQYYLAEVKKQKLQLSKNPDEIVYLTEEYKEKTIEGEVLDELGMNRYCCRRIFLSNTNIIDEI